MTQVYPFIHDHWSEICTILSSMLLLVSELLGGASGSIWGKVIGVAKAEVDKSAIDPRNPPVPPK